MALVAYGSSDSDTSDSEQENSDNPVVSSKLTSKLAETPAPGRPAEVLVDSEASQPRQPAINNSTVNTPAYSNPHSTIEAGHISDEDEDFMLSNVADEGGGVSGSLQLPAPKKQMQDANGLVLGGQPASDNTVNNATGLLKGLPAPQLKEQHKVSGYQAADEGELEDLVKPKPAELALREKNTSKPKSKTTIKITVPSLDQYDSDEEDGPRKKKAKNNAKGGSGLFALLPQPVHAAKKEAGRVLLPYSISRKPKAPVVPAARPPHGTPTGGAPRTVTATTVTSAGLAALPMVDSDSEPEEDQQGTSENFFSLGDHSRGTTLPVTSIPLAPVGLIPVVPLKPVRDAPTKTEKVQMTGPEKGSLTGHGLDSQINDCEEKSGSERSASAKMGSLADAPLEFRGQAGPSVDINTGWSSAPAVEQRTENETGDMVDDDPEMEDADGSPENEEASGQLWQNEQFLRMQGKHGRGREQVDFIDVCADDMTNAADLLKNISGDSTEGMKSHSKKKNKDMPSSQQKRKHQITYLAFKAKEREMDLKNQWADNKMTKKQTQSKYGF